ncbi:MAG: tetratricopeptide repeat protein [Chitinophagaceae bacterium]|nr:tetratricopeptide repeat protein [Chitinophagaceae bacterium]
MNCQQFFSFFDDGGCLKNHRFSNIGISSILTNQPILANLGNAYYRLGDMNSAMKYLQHCVQIDSLHPTANKILCMMYFKKGDSKKAAEHGTRSLTASYDHEVISMLRQLNSKVKPGEIMSRLPVKEFPLLKRTRLPAMPSELDKMADFVIELNAEKESLNMTIAEIVSKMPKQKNDMQEAILRTNLIRGILPITIKAQHIIMDAMQIYQNESITTSDVFHYNLKKLASVHNPKIRAISKRYNDQLNKLEGGEAGDEDKIQALELEKCNAINAANEKYLAELAPLVNEFAQRKEYISRKFYSDYANYAPLWTSETVIPFPSIERDYLQDIANILGEYQIISKSDCSVFEPPVKKNGKLKEWEDEYCSNFKGKISMGSVKFFFTCNSWGIDGGEGIVADAEFKYRNDGAFENFTVGAGLGANWHLGKDGFVNTEIGVSGKGFVKIGPDATTGKWIIQDVGVKAEVAGEASIGKVSVEEKVLEVSLAVNAGMERGGIVPAIFNVEIKN